MEEREEKFEPGPYKVVIGETTVIADSDNYRMANLTYLKRNGRRDGDTVIATAHLFAAAPELYEALKVALPYIEDMDTPKIENLARVALQKARGQQ